MAMPHTRFNVGHHTDIAFRQLSLKARGMVLTAHTFCSDKLTDGFIPATFLADHGRGREARLAINELVSKGWWVPQGDGYVSTTYLADNPDADEVNQRLEANRERQARLRDRRRQGQLPWAEEASA